MNKVAVVTGAAKGLGAEIALFLSDCGYDIALHYNKSEPEAKVLLGKIQKKSSSSKLFCADLKDEEEVKKFAGDVLKTYGQVDLLVNNVGNFLYKKFADTTNSEFKDVLESNVYATLFTSRAFLPSMRKQKEGLIINIGCVGAERIVLRDNSMPYFMAKTDVYMITKMMAWEEAKSGVRINMISPASLKTDIFKDIDFPMGRSARYEDVIGALKFLMSDESHYVNGANIEVAGAFVPGMN